MSGGSITTVSVSNHSGGAHVEGWVVMNQNLSDTSLIPPQNCHYQLPGRSCDRKLHQQVFNLLEGDFPLLSLNSPSKLPLSSLLLLEYQASGSFVAILMRKIINSTKKFEMWLKSLIINIFLPAFFLSVKNK